MTKFINKFTGGDMWVADDRIKEYEAAGHRLAAYPDAEKTTNAKLRKRTKKDGNGK